MCYNPTPIITATLLLYYDLLPVYIHVQSFLASPHTFVPQDIVRFTESTGLLNQFTQDFLHFFPFGMNFCADLPISE